MLDSVQKYLFPVFDGNLLSKWCKVVRKPAGFCCLVVFLDNPVQLPLIFWLNFGELHVQEKQLEMVIYASVL